MSKTFLLSSSLVAAFVLVAPGPVRAQGADDEEELESGGDLELESRTPGGEYQLSGPESLTTPEELLGGSPAVGDEELDEDEEGEAAPEAADEEADGEEVSLELDLAQEEEGGALPPVHPVPPEEPLRLRWFLIPPYYQGFRGEAGVRLFFPFYFQRWSAEGQQELAVLPFYYQSRGPAAEDAVDMAFPLVYWMRSAERRTLVVANVWWSESEASSHAGVAPLVAWGHTRELSYQVGFPLFFRFRWSDQRQFWLAGLAFNQTFESGYRRGFFPIVWMFESHGRGTMVGFPLLYHFWNRSEGSSLTVVPPFYVQLFQNGYGFGVAPLLFVSQRARATRATVFPLFHYRSEATGDRTFASPLAWYHREGTTTMGGVLLYHWMRSSHSRFDGLIPFYLSGEDRRLGSRWRYVFPLVFSGSSPVRRSTVLFPAVWDFEERHRSRTTAVLPFMVHHQHLYEDVHTTWVVPTFQYSRRVDGWDFNFHPLLYLSQGDDRSHQVLFPIFWRFHRPGSTHTVAFPLWWDFQGDGSRFQAFFPFYWHNQTRDGQWTAVLNVVYASGQREVVPYWSLNVFPVFRVGRPAPEDIDWQILLGLMGYGRRGSRQWVDAFWVPFELGGGERGAGGDDGEGADVAPPAEDEPVDVGRDDTRRPSPAVAAPVVEPRG